MSLLTVSHFIVKSKTNGFLQRLLILIVSLKHFFRYNNNNIERNITYFLNVSVTSVELYQTSRINNAHNPSINSNIYILVILHSINHTLQDILIKIVIITIWIIETIDYFKDTKRIPECIYKYKNFYLIKVQNSYSALVNSQFES